MTPLTELFELYLLAAYGEQELTPEQKRTLRSAFFTGALSVFTMLAEVPVVLPEAEKRARYNAICDDITKNLGLTRDP